MFFLEALAKLKQSKEFKDWVIKNEDSYLSYGFLMPTQEEEEWQIGFYMPKIDKITTFVVSKNILINPETEVFKNEDKVKELDIKKNISYKDALDFASTIQKEKYSQHKPIKTIMILQNINIGQVWNITYITNAYKTLNIKLNSKTSAVISDELIEMFQFTK